jgi:O-methyltransferase involved in polyketide biosynthesis
MISWYGRVRPEALTVTRSGGSTVIDEPDCTGADASAPRCARVWDHWLGGEDNFPVDREAGDAWAAADPGVVAVARGSRAFLGRTVRWLAEEAGIRQFLDIGAGLPSAGNTHQVAHRVAPGSRVVYVDHDPLVLVQAKGLLAGGPPGRAHFLDADLLDPAGLLKAAGGLLDLDRPVAVLLLGVLGHVPDLDDARDVVRYLMDRTCRGSYLAVQDATRLVDDAAVREAQRRYADTGAMPYRTRDPQDIESFFEGLEFVEPGLVPVQQWRPDPDTDPAPVDAWGGVGRKR